MTVFIILCLNTALIRAPNLLSTAYLDTPSNLYTLIIHTDQRQNKRSLISFYIPALPTIIYLLEPRVYHAFPPSRITNQLPDRLRCVC